MNITERQRRYGTNWETVARKYQARVAELEKALRPFTMLTKEGDDKIMGAYISDNGRNILAKGSLLESIEVARAALDKGQS